MVHNTSQADVTNYCLSKMCAQIYTKCVTVIKIFNNRPIIGTIWGQSTTISNVAFSSEQNRHNCRHLTINSPNCLGGFFLMRTCMKIVARLPSASPASLGGEHGRTRVRPIFPTREICGISTYIYLCTRAARTVSRVRTIFQRARDRPAGCLFVLIVGGRTWGLMTYTSSLSSVQAAGGASRCRS